MHVHLNKPKNDPTLKWLIISKYSYSHLVKIIEIAEIAILQKSIV